MPAKISLQLPEAAYSPVGSEVYCGLTSTPKTLSPWLLYDAEGSRIFEEITELPEYYPTRTERDILAANADGIIATANRGGRLSIVELGAGTATKTGLLLEAAVRQQGKITYHAIDVSPSPLEEAKSRLERELPGVTVVPRVADYTAGLSCIDTPAGKNERRLLLYIGSSIGNFSPEEALSLLRRAHAHLIPGEALLLGVDMVKDRATLSAAYDDGSGVTAAFNKNVLRRINRELGGNFNLDRFHHRALWNPHHSRMEMHLLSSVSQRVSIAALDLDIDFANGETIHTENSYKFTDDGVAALLSQAGFALRGQWKDSRNWFGVYLAVAD